MLSGQRLADAVSVFKTLFRLSQQYGLGLDWVLASGGISAHESGGFDRTAHNKADPNGGSKGFWQINGIHGVPESVATDPVASTEWWFANMQPAKHWAACGGSAAFAADGVAFMRCYAPKTQVSVPWTAAHATNALALAREAFTAAFAGLVGLPAAGTGGAAGAANEPEPTDPIVTTGPGGVPIKVCPPGRTLGSDGKCHDTGWGLPSLPNPLGPVKDLQAGLTRLVGALFDRDVWVRVALFGGGIVLALLGVQVMFSGSDTYRQGKAAAITYVTRGAARGKGGGGSGSA